MVKRDEETKPTGEQGSGNSAQQAEKGPVFRETFESFAVALILAFLFRAFVAEAFVIPTGSMAPTLMGAHKDVRCSQCGFGYQSGASTEFNELGGLQDRVVVGTTCPICRYEMPLDLKGDANHATFSGDRILVSKFSYVSRQPQRWEVIVFKFPDNARQNYIKRLVGRPHEKLRVQHGDIFIAPEATPERLEIARKPPRIVQTLLQPVSDTNHRPKDLVKAGLPSEWQPFPMGDRSSAKWQVDSSETRWQASYQGTAEPQRLEWLRFFHRVVDPWVWRKVQSQGKFPVPIDPYSSRLITDFAHYNASLTTSRRSVYGDRRGGFAPSYRSGEDPRANDTMSFFQRSCIENDGTHWVGDLALETEVVIEKGTGTLVLDLVEMGIHHQCRIDTQSGQATLLALRGDQPLAAFEDLAGGLVTQATASTSVRGPGRYRLRLTNVDDQLTLWVGDKVQKITPSGNLRSESYLNGPQRRPHWSPADPLDAAPAGIGFQGIDGKVERAKISRDVYYVATDGASPYNDYRNWDGSLQLSLKEEDLMRYLERVDPSRLKDRTFLAESRTALRRDALYSTPRLWEMASVFPERREKDFLLGDKEYFPMGDNSMESFDARGWPDHHVPERLLIGRAIVVFWPHFWNRPIPFLPNVQRMGLIR
jgi:signal peptidase I